MPRFLSLLSATVMLLMGTLPALAQDTPAPEKIWVSNGWLHVTWTALVERDQTTLAVHNDHEDFLGVARLTGPQARDLWTFFSTPHFTPQPSMGGTGDRSTLTGDPTADHPPAIVRTTLGPGAESFAVSTTPALMERIAVLESLPLTSVDRPHLVGMIVGPQHPCTDLTPNSRERHLVNTLLGMVQNQTLMVAFEDRDGFFAQPEREGQQTFCLNLGQAGFRFHPLNPHEDDPRRGLTREEFFEQNPSFSQP